MQMPSLRVIKMQGVSHWLMLDKPEEFNHILDDFLKERGVPPDTHQVAGPDARRLGRDGRSP